MPFIPVLEGVLWLLYNIIPFPGVVCLFCTTSYPTRNVLLLLYNFHGLTQQFCNLCNNFVPVAGYGLCLLYPYPRDVCDLCTTSYPTGGSLYLLYNIILYSKRSVTSLQLPYRYPTVFILCNISYRYQCIWYTFPTRTRGSSVTSVQHYTLPETFRDLCITFIPYPTVL